MSYLLPESATLIPPASSSIWEGLTQELLAQISTPKTTDEACVWGREHRYTHPLTKNMLAWLSFKDLIHYDVVDFKWKLGPEPSRGDKR
jgi:hypothetical protein